MGSLRLLEASLSTLSSLTVKMLAATLPSLADGTLKTDLEGDENRTDLLIKQLEALLRDVQEHSNLYSSSWQNEQASASILRAQEANLNRQFGRLEPYILKVSTTQFRIEGESVNPWRNAFTPGIPLVKQMCLDTIIQEINRIIGHYESRAEEEVTVEDLEVLFNSMKLHTKIVEVSKSLFIDQHYPDAILSAFKEVILSVRNTSGLKHLDGKPLMEQAFALNNPKIKLNNLVTQSDKDEQNGFSLIYSGVALGIRNPKAHENVKQDDPHKTLGYLSIASLLLTRLDERVKDIHPSP